MTQQTYDENLIWPATPSARVAGAFNWWLARMVRKDFHRVLIARDESGEPTQRHLAALEGHRGPAVVVMNHACWWDPLIGLYLARRLCPSRTILGPMELEQLRKFAFFRKLGVFGINPDDPRAFEQMLAYVRERFATDPTTMFWLTPQGQFTDPRVRVRIRPGAAAVAARAGDGSGTGVCRIVSVAVELAFWTDRRPEMLVRFASADAEPGSTSTTTRIITSTMQANADALAARVIARDDGGFVALEESAGGGTNPLYDFWLRMTGRTGRIVGTDRGMSQTPGGPRVAVGGSTAPGPRAETSERAKETVA